MNSTTFCLLLIIIIPSFATSHKQNETEYELYRRFMSLEQHCNKTLSHQRPQFDKFILFIIDALRIDFVPSVANVSIPAERMRLPFMEGLIKQHGIALQSIASIPTVTLPRVKALLSGTLPSFMDYILNLNAYSFAGDNIVHQFAFTQGRRIHFYGDDTWGRLFPQDVRRPAFARSNLTSSFFVTDYTEVDTNVTYNVRRELRNLSGWDVMILHYLGLDHIGHSHGFYSSLIPAKLHEMDDYFREIYQTLIKSNESALIVITGDHGMTKEGNHGGNTRDETHTPLIFLSTNPAHHHVSRFDHYHRLLLSERTYLQIDFAPTLSALFGLAIPRANQGRLISPVLDRFAVPKAHHLCWTFQNAIQIQHVIPPVPKDDSVALEEFLSLKAILDQAMRHHETYLKHQEVADGNYEESLLFYEKFLDSTQRLYVKNLDSNPGFYQMALILSLIVLFGIVFAILWLEFQNPDSIFFTVLIRKFYHKIDEDRNSFYGSAWAQLLMLALVIANIVSMASTQFMQTEHVFWNILGAGILLLKLLVSFRSKSTKSVILSLCALSLFLGPILHWKIVILSTQWGDSDPHSQDIYSWLKDSRPATTVAFIASLILMNVLLFREYLGGNLLTMGIVLSGQLFVYLYRSETGFLMRLPGAASQKNPNIYAQIVYWHALLLVVHCTVDKLRLSSLFTAQKLPFFRLPATNTTVSSHLPNQTSASLGPLRTLTLVWVLLSSLLIEPYVMPLLALNIALEALVRRILGPTRLISFYHLGVYLIFAQSAFYQLGNTNSLSTVSVQACFIGLNSYRMAPCAGLMIIAIYSIHLYWLLAFFVRLEAAWSGKRPDETSHRPAWATPHGQFNSIIAAQQCIRLAVQVTALIVIFVLRDHPYIWSVLCPKLLYELMFTGLHLALALLMSAIFLFRFYYSK